MNRTVWIAIGTGTMISGAAAIGIDAQSVPAGTTLSHAQRAVVLDSARRAQRDGIDARYLADRGKCDALGGLRKDRCLIDAHARKGRALLEAAAPYSIRS